jgi:putative endonuclease
MVNRQQILGADGEAVVARHYERLGYDVIERNWRCSDGEIDLILSRAATIVFCEVKTRTSDRFGGGAAAVGWQKQRRIRGLAARWLREIGPHTPDVRFDVAVVTSAGRGFAVELIEAAF